MVHIFRLCGLHLQLVVCVFHLGGLHLPLGVVHIFRLGGLHLPLWTQDCQDPWIPLSARTVCLNLHWDIRSMDVGVRTQDDVMSKQTSVEHPTHDELPPKSH